MSKGAESTILTVAAIRQAKGGAATQFLFNERQSIYRVPETLATARQSVDRLRGALKEGAPLRVALDLRRGLVRRVTIPSGRELEAFRRERILLEKPGKGFPIDVAKIDPTTFNLVDKFLKVPVFRLCTRVIPNYAAAKAIFDFCAQQSCSLPGPYGVTPCIPFQYVRDGCYARAHKMRRIITSRYRYCCEKVFSFANRNNDVLAVQATKWGGCCVQWWYHVAPLVRVKVKNFFTLAMVIDPGMFDKPVLLSTWLAAQENTACGPNANLSMYSIQAGSAYSPANYAGTAFTTDPSYTATDATLVAYSGLTTCP